MRGLELILWSQGQWEASEKTASNGADKHTNKHTDGHRDFMTESDQWSQFSEKRLRLQIEIFLWNPKPNKPNPLKNNHITLFLIIYIFFFKCIVDLETVL